VPTALVPTGYALFVFDSTPGSRKGKWWAHSHSLAQVGSEPGTPLCKGIYLHESDSEIGCEGNLSSV
jgi:hypothetical protein